MHSKAMSSPKKIALLVAFREAGKSVAIYRLPGKGRTYVLFNDRHRIVQALPKYIPITNTIPPPTITCNMVFRSGVFMNL